MESVKKKKRKPQDLTEAKNVDINRKMNIFIVVVIVILIVMFGWSQFVSMRRISVVKLAHNVTAGDIVDVNTVFKKHDMLYTAYLEEGAMNVLQPDGTVKRQQGYVKWEDRGKYQDWYFNSYQSEDTPFTVNSASKEMQYKNPLIEEMPVGNEEYVLNIDPAGIDINQLYPGTTLSLRVAFKVPISLEEECRRALANKINYDGSSVILKLLNERGYSTTSEGVEDSLENPGFGDFSGVSMDDDDRTTYISEVIFNDIKAVDMLSGSGESIYEVYLALLKMPLSERIVYLQTSFEDDKSGEFRERITPKSIVLNLKPSEASSLHEFEAVGYDTKWTIVKTAKSSDMLKDFIEINNQVNSMKG